MPEKHYILYDNDGIPCSEVKELLSSTVTTVITTNREQYSNLMALKPYASVLYYRNICDGDSMAKGLEICNRIFDIATQKVLPELSPESRIMFKALKAGFINQFNNALCEEAEIFSHFKEFLNRTKSDAPPQVCYIGQRYRETFKRFCLANSYTHQMPAPLQRPVKQHRKFRPNYIDSVRATLSFLRFALKPRLFNTNRRHPIDILAYCGNDRYRDVVPFVDSSYKTRILLDDTQQVSNISLPWRKLAKFSDIFSAWRQIAQFKNIILKSQPFNDPIHAPTAWQELSKLAPYAFRSFILLAILKRERVHRAPRILYNTCPATVYGQCINLYFSQEQIPIVIVKRAFHRDDVESNLYAADRLLVWGRYSKSVFIKYGMSSRSIRLTGPVIFDSFVSKLKQSDSFRQKLLKRLPLSRRKTRLCFYGPQPIEDRYSIADKRHVLSTLLNTFKECSQSDTLIIKNHPSESPTELALYQKYIEEYQIDNVFVFKHSVLSIDEAIIGSDIVLCRWSTIGFNAVIAGKPLITLNFTGMRSAIFLYYQAGISKMAKNGGELFSLLDDEHGLQTLASSSATQKFLQEQIVELDGKAAQRIQEEIKQLAFNVSTVQNKSF